MKLRQDADIAIIDLRILFMNAGRFRSFSLGPLLSKLYVYAFHLKNSKMKNLNKHTEIL